MVHDLFPENKDQQVKSGVAKNTGDVKPDPVEPHADISAQVKDQGHCYIAGYKVNADKGKIRLELPQVYIDEHFG
jgi:hypothetical protein